MISNKINNKLESPLISVIIPVYNVEEYLDNCLHSVVNQTLKDIEIICIDDGSTGAESEILDYYAKLDNRIKIIKQDNKGLSASRNAGMKLATAPYIMFCDSDDAYDLHMCEKMLAGIQSSGADLAICDIQECFSSDFEGIKVHNAYFDIKISGLFEINVEQIPNISSVVWNKIFRKDLIQKYNLQFPEGLYWEDNPFWFAYGSLCSKIFFISEKLYTYNRHGNTITSDWFAGKIPLRLVDYIRNAIWLYNWFNTNNLYKQHFQSYWNCFLRFFNLSAFIPEVSVEGRELSCSLAIDFLNKVADQSDAEYKVAQVILGSIKQLKKENDKKIAQKARLTLARQKWLKTRKNSIPKIIHYCWFGGKPFSPLIKKCIASWKKFCPDWEIREWNESNFDVNICQYTKEAYEAKKFAFVSDYARLYALVNYGGIYLDTDCELTKPIDKFLDHEAVSGFENEISIQTAVMGCQEGFPLFKELLERYTSRRFVMANGLYDQTTNVQDITSFCLDLGFIPNGQKQEVCGLTLYPRDYFCPLDYITHSIVAYTKNTHVIHYFNVSWLDSNNSVTKTTLRQSLEHAGGGGGGGGGGRARRPASAPPTR
ncbi:MAG: glycosyltransferase, partial [Deltaproteobacteria bacterium]|nr:glycosyltransferase [Deltaproteobacteria bacterium]